METFDTIKLIFWLNGKAVDSCFTLGVPSSIDTIKKLKEAKEFYDYLSGVTIVTSDTSSEATAE